MCAAVDNTCQRFVGASPAASWTKMPGHVTLLVSLEDGVLWLWSLRGQREGRGLH